MPRPWSASLHGSVAALVELLDRRRWSWLSLLLCLAVVWVRFGQIDASLPYARHEDERPIAQAALRVLQSDSHNPRFFNYGSLPIYGASAGIVVGAIQAARAQELRKIGDVRQVRPHYSHPRVMAAPRKLFAVLSALCLWLVGVIAARTFKTPFLRLAAPVALLFPSQFVSKSWEYLNVDLWAGLFACATLAWLMSCWQKQGFRHKALIPAALAAGAIASKYNAATLVVPCLLAIALTEARGVRLVRSGQFLALLLAFFVLYCPYSLLDTPGFLNGVLHEAAHYARGHNRFTVEPGWAHLRRIGETLHAQYGTAWTLLGVGGIALGLRVHARRTLVLLSAILASVAFMSTQRVFFPRNLIPVLALLAPFAGGGAVALARLLVGTLQRVSKGRLGLSIPALTIACSAVLSAAIVVSFGPSRFLEQQGRPRESRLQAARWLNGEARGGELVLVDAALQGAWRKLREEVRRKATQLTHAPEEFAQASFLVMAEDTKLAEPLARRLAGMEPVFVAGSGSTDRKLVLDPKLKVYRLNP